MGEIPDSHPRKASLLARAKLTEAASQGLLAESALIAHGRGEAFDYLLGEKTSESASLAIRENNPARLLKAERAVISLNGNTTVLAGEQAIRAAAIIGCPVEVNIYYRTPERMEILISTLENLRFNVANQDPPLGWDDSQWPDIVNSVDILGGMLTGELRGSRASLNMQFSWHRGSRCCARALGRWRSLRGLGSTRETSIGHRPKSTLKDCQGALCYHCR